MEENIASFSKIFDSTIRIQILASLLISPMTYSELRKVCHCADGAMTNHTSKLHKAGYIKVKKEFVDNKPLTTYTITRVGKSEFEKFVNTLNYSMNQEKSDEENVYDSNNDIIGV